MNPREDSGKVNGMIRASKLAAELGVGRELLEGLVHGKQVGGEFRVGRSGQSVCFVYPSEVDRLREIIGGKR